MSIYQIGDAVQVNLPAGWNHGRVVAVLKKYAFSKETKYEIHGDQLITITGARNMKAAA